MLIKEPRNKRVESFDNSVVEIMGREGRKDGRGADRENKGK